LGGGGGQRKGRFPPEFKSGVWFWAKLVSPELPWLSPGGNG